MRWFLAVCLVLYLCFVARLTLADPASGQFAFSLADTWATRLSHGRLQWSETEVLANIALFVPIGFLLTALVRRPGLVLVLCFFGSAGIELSQREFLPTRVATVADVQHNVLGAVLGVVVAVPVIWLVGGAPDPRATSALVDTLRIKFERKQGLRAASKTRCAGGHGVTSRHT